MARKCPHCDSENTDTAHFCSNCAAPLPDVEGDVHTKTLERPVEELIRGSVFAGRYEIIEELGKGGMGKVYRVEDTKVKEEVALKLIKPEISADKKTIERFRNELKIARKIRHKNVCAMFDLGEEKGSHYITMEYVSGEDLKTLIRRVKVDIKTSIKIAKQVCEGLSEAHRLGVVHRDLKPSNIMIDKEGDVRIMDFGIARTFESKGITDAGLMIGTPDYMSPEQAEGMDVDQSSDIYSLGIILYEMIAGQLPFDGDTPLSVVMKHKSEKPRDPKFMNPQIPDDLSSLILKCIEKEKKNRYQSAENLLSDITRIEMAIDSQVKKKTDKISEAAFIGYSEGKNSIAVLPFVDLSPEKDQEYFCDGLAEELISVLSMISELQVVARTSAFSFKGKNVDIREIGRKLNVLTMLEGSVRKSGNRLRITAQLINTEDGFHLWTERYDREMDDIFAIQDDISLAIVNSLKLKLLRAEKEAVVKRHTENIEAYNLYLHGRYLLNKSTRESLTQAIQYFEQAIAMEPKYSKAIAGISLAHFQHGILHFCPAKEAFPQAKNYAVKALQIDETIAVVHTALANIKMFYDWEWEEAEKEIKRALEINPSSTSAHDAYAGYCLLMGNREKAIEEALRYIELDPISFSAYFHLGVYYLRSGKLQNAKNQFQKALELVPNHPFGLWMLGQAEVLDAHYHEGLSKIKKAYNLSGDHTGVLAGLGWSYAVSGYSQEAQNILNDLMQRAKKEYIPPFYIAKIHNGLGNKTQALDWLDKAYEEHDTSLVHIKTDETLDNLRSEPRFTALLEKMSLKYTRKQ
jgi:serine/threonine protein kinase/Tfp pilus assembly protein PilF